MLNQCKILFEKWNNNNLRYCHWKGNDHLAEALEGVTDLDVLLDKNDKELGCSILLDIDFIQCQSQYGYRYPNVDDWVGFDRNTGKLIHLHLHFALMSGHQGLKEYELPWGKEALDTRVKDENTNVFIINPNLELVSLYTRLVLKANKSDIHNAKKGDYVINNHFIKEIDYIKRKVNWHETEEIVKRYYKNDSERFVEYAKLDGLNSSQFLDLFSIVSARMKPYSRYKGIKLSLLRDYYNLAIWLRGIAKRRFKMPLISHKIPKGGCDLSVAFLGQDGSGKSTITLEIEKWLTWKLEARRFYLGSGEHYNSFLKRFISGSVQIKHKIKSPKSSVNNKKSESNGKRKKNIISFFSSMLDSLYLLMVARRAYKTMIKAEQYSLKGGIPLFDRYPQMQFEGISDGPKISYMNSKNGLDFKINKWLSQKELHYFKEIQRFQPKLVFKLLLSPEESIRRKPFENLESVRRKHEITKELSFPQSVVYSVDATQDYQSEIIFIKNKIWDAILQK